MKDYGDFKEGRTDAYENLQDLRQEYDDLKNDWNYIKSLLDSEFEKNIDLKREIEQLKQQNKELKLDNDIKFWKHQFMMNYNKTQLIMHELAKAIDNGYDVSSEFQKYLNELKARNNENREKMERLGI